MNAPAHLMPTRESYFSTVRAFKPLCEGEELECRASLLLMRDKAMATKRRASESAWAILDVVQKLADDNALEYRTSLGDLREIRRQCIRLVGCAAGLDMIFAPQLPLPPAPEVA